MKEGLIKLQKWKKAGPIINLPKTAFFFIFFVHSVFGEVYEWGGSQKFDYHSIKNINVVESERRNYLQLKRFSVDLSEKDLHDSLYINFNESFLDLSRRNNPIKNERHLALLGEKVIKADYRIIRAKDTIGNAASFELQNHTLWMRMPDYLFFNQRDKISDFSIYFRLKFYKLRQSAEFFSRYGFYDGRKTGIAGTWDKEKIKFEFFHFFSNKSKRIPYFEIYTRDIIEKNQYYNIMLRYQAAEGSLTLFLNGIEQNKVYVTSTGRSNGTVFKPAFHRWDRSPVVLSRNFIGSIDEVIFSNRILSLDPSAGNYGKIYEQNNRYAQKKGIILGNVHKLQYSRSKITRIEYHSDEPSSSDVDLFFRSSNKPFRADTDESILPFRKISENQRVKDNKTKRPPNEEAKYYQFKAVLFADSSGENTPSLDSVKMHYLDNPPPAAPKFLSAYKVSENEVRLVFMRNNEMDVLNGGKYMVYYGVRPFEPLGKIYYKDIISNSGVIKKVSFNDKNDRLKTDDLKMQNRIMVTINNDIILKNLIYIRNKPHLYYKNPPLQKGIPYYFWVTSTDSAWDEDPEFFDHESKPSNSIVVRVEDSE